MVEELAPFWPAPRAVPGRVNEDQMTGVSTNAVEVEFLSTSLSRSKYQRWSFSDYEKDLTGLELVCNKSFRPTTALNSDDLPLLARPTPPSAYHIWILPLKILACYDDLWDGKLPKGMCSISGARTSGLPSSFGMFEIEPAAATNLAFAKTEAWSLVDKCLLDGATEMWHV